MGFRKLDVDCSGTISAQEFERCIKNGDVERFLVGRGIDIKDAKTFFTMLSESMGKDKEVDIGTIVGSCLRIKGVATSIDLQILRYEARTAARRHAELASLVHALVAERCGSRGSSSELESFARCLGSSSSVQPSACSGSRRGTRPRLQPEEPKDGTGEENGYYGLL